GQVGQAVAVEVAGQDVEPAGGPGGGAPAGGGHAGAAVADAHRPAAGGGVQPGQVLDRGQGVGLGGGLAGGAVGQVDAQGRPAAAAALADSQAVVGVVGGHLAAAGAVLHAGAVAGGVVGEGQGLAERLLGHADAVERVVGERVGAAGVGGGGQV